MGIITACVIIQFIDVVKHGRFRAKNQPYKILSPEPSLLPICDVNKRILVPDDLLPRYHRPS